MSLFFLALAFPLHFLAAESGTSVDPFVVAQLKSDCLQFVKQKASAGLTAEQQNAAMENVVSQIVQGEAPVLAFTPAQLQSLQKGVAIFTDTETKDAYSELKKVAHGRPMPVIVEYYKGIYDSGKMTASQKAIFVRLTLGATVQVVKQK